MSNYLEKMLAQGKDFSEISPLNFYRYDELIKRLKNEPPLPIIKTPYPALNSLVELEGGRLYVLGAPPKQGKTAFVLSLFYGLSKMNQKTLLFSYEMSWKEVIKKIAEMETYDRIEPGSIMRPFFMPIEMHRGGGTLQLDWLLEAIAKAKDEGVKLIAIDHLHFLIPYQISENFSIAIGNVVREIKRMAVMFDLPIILITPMKNLQQERKPTYWDIRDSSMIMHDADDIIIMYRARKDGKKKISDSDLNNEYVPFSILSLELSRKRGATGNIILWHNGAYFEEKDAILLKQAIEN